MPSHVRIIGGSEVDLVEGPTEPWVSRIQLEEGSEILAIGLALKVARFRREQSEFVRLQYYFTKNSGDASLAELIDPTDT